MFSKEELEIFLRGCEELLELADSQQIPDTGFGICTNLSITIGEELLAVACTEPCDIVCEYCEDWPGRGNRTVVFPVNDVRGVGKWEGSNLKQRKNLLRHLITRIKKEIEERK